jgi:hypothetical protein
LPLFHFQHHIPPRAGTDFYHCLANSLK